MCYGLRKASLVTFWIAVVLGVLASLFFITFGKSLYKEGYTEFNYSVIGWFGIVVTPITTILRLKLQQDRPGVAGAVTIISYGGNVFGILSAIFIWIAAARESNQSYSSSYKNHSIYDDYKEDNDSSNENYYRNRSYFEN